MGKLLYFSYDITYVPKEYSYKIFSDENELISKISGL